MRDGEVVATMPIAGTTTAGIIRHMVGRELKDVFPKRAKPDAEIRLEVRNLSRSGVLKDISFDVRRGEIVGICGLAGSGRTEVLARHSRGRPHRWRRDQSRWRSGLDRHAAPRPRSRNWPAAGRPQDGGVVPRPVGRLQRHGVGTRSRSAGAG